MNSIDKFLEKRKEMRPDQKAVDDESIGLRSNQNNLLNPFLPKFIMKDVSAFQVINGNYHFVNIEPQDLNQNFQEIVQKDLINKMLLGRSLKSLILPWFTKISKMESTFDIEEEDREIINKQRKILEDIFENNKNISKLRFLI